jgi:histidyl-tRNA synthetase
MPSKPSRTEILAETRRLFDVHGFEALTTPFLEKKRLYARIWAAGLT